MNATSPWAVAAKVSVDDQQPDIVFSKEIGGYAIQVYYTNNSLWISVACPKGARIVLRPAYTPDNQLKPGKVSSLPDGVRISLSACIGHFQVELRFPAEDAALLRYTTTFRAGNPQFFPFWPRDMVIVGPRTLEEGNIEGTVHISQEGTRSGLQYFSLDEPQSGTVLYFQNLTAINDYAQLTETSLGNVVGGTWPELGFALPPTIKNKPVPAHRDVVISDAFLAFDQNNPKSETELARQFLNLLASIYIDLPKPQTQYYDWPGMVDQGLHDLEFNHGCWSHGAEQDYLNAYVADYKTPPESMVQLAVLLPLVDYHDWCKTDLPAIMKIKNGLDAFYNDDLKTIVRFLPAQEAELDGSEEQLKPNVMDSWYLHHPLLNLGRLALRGDKQGKKLFLGSLDFTIRVARHFNYEWPVMYNIETLEVVKAETQPGAGGEKDVAGLYALVMLHAWQLTKENKYLLEAKKAAKTLKNKGFHLFYQANNTAFSANAMLWLHIETGEKVYLDLAYLCLANLFKNLQLWECDYGFAKNHPTFFAIFPLNDAPYTAAYEEQEVFAALHNFLLYADQADILPSVALLVPEFLRYLVNRAPYYYPPNLPKEMLAKEVKTGQVDHKLWIAIEDIHDGWEQSGSVGQEVYGAGVAFGIIPRHFYRVPDEDFMIYIDYPAADFKSHKGSVSFKVSGDSRLTCRMLIIKNGSLPVFSVACNEEQLKGMRRKDDHLEFLVPGDQYIRVKWNAHSPEKKA
ncbi:hypothetical protein GS399_19770 [Pedobacter sp. HMF7647]|uniref:Uncharacterized protein n=1 Tax=Hufsiella arboris TaxID=2695275 RepID=A0A7K1YFK6_9SPHI|nr:hypothetical protein [Hufsiella arboris]MXV53210.1 hypothetical protein [Hufsiella arboris]